MIVLCVISITVIRSRAISAAILVAMLNTEPAVTGLDSAQHENNKVRCSNYIMC